MDVAAKFDDLPPAHAWAWRPWTAFGPSPACAVIPICGFAQHSANAPLNQEEALLTALLSRTLGTGMPFLTLPVVRFVLGPSPLCAFSVDPELFHAQLSELCASVASSGVRRVVLLNASPWNEAGCDVAARDIRIEQGLQLFCVHLTGLGLRVTTPTSPSAVENAASRLRALLEEIRARPALPNAGGLAAVQAQ